MNRKFQRKLILIGLTLAVVMCLTLIIGNNIYAQSSKKNKGLNFQVPDDWPIEKRGGLLGPIPIDEYVVMKFNIANEEISAVKNELLVKLDELASSLKSIELKFSDGINKDQPQTEEKQDDANFDNILIRLNQLESEISRLNRLTAEHTTELDSQKKKTVIKFIPVKKSIGDLQTRILRLEQKVDTIAAEEGI